MNTETILEIGARCDDLSFSEMEENKSRNKGSIVEQVTDNINVILWCLSSDEDDPYAVY